MYRRNGLKKGFGVLSRMQTAMLKTAKAAKRRNEALGTLRVSFLFYCSADSGCIIPITVYYSAAPPFLSAHLEKFINLWYNELSCECNHISLKAGCVMVRNDFEIDVKVKCLKERITQAQLAEMVGTSAPYISRLINKQDGIVNKTFVEMLDKLSYDFQITYVKKETN